MAAAKPLVALAAILLLAAPAAFADNPTVRIARADQERAVGSLLTLKDFASGWQGGPTKTQSLAGAKCPGFDPKESDLTVTGHANAAFHSPGAQLYQDVQVLRTEAAVQADYARSITADFGRCLQYRLRASTGVTSATVERIVFPTIGDVSAAFRATLTAQDHGHVVHLTEDFVFFGVGRTEYSIRIVALSSLRSQLVPFESGMASMLVKRAAKPCC